jgi:hypothetical protein
MRFRAHGATYSIAHGRDDWSTPLVSGAKKED